MASKPKDQSPPHNVEAERALLGSILLDNSACNLALETISKEDFYRDGHNLTFDVICKIIESGRAADLVTISHELSKLGLLEKAGGAAYLAALTDGVPIGTTSAMPEYCRIVKEASTIRRLIRVSDNLRARCFEGVDDADTLIALGQEQIIDIASDRINKGFLSIEEIIKREMKYFERLFEGKSPVTGIAAGFTDLDVMTRGFQPGELTVIAARPSLGKTALALSMIHSEAERAVPAGFFSLETNQASLVSRLLCMESLTNIHNLWRGFSSREDWGKLIRAMGVLSKRPIYIDDTSSLSITKLRAKARRLKIEKGAAIFYVDYLQLVTTDRRFNSRNDEVGYISSSLKDLAKEEKVPVVALCQLSRAGERGPQRKPKLSDLRESGSIEQDADVVIFIWKGKNEDATTLIIGKQRNGPVGEIKVNFLRDYTKFVEFSPQAEDGVTVP